MQQMHMHCRYDPSQVTLTAENQWRHGDETDAFLDYVLSAPCTAAVKDLQIQSLGFDLHDV